MGIQSGGLASEIGSAVQQEGVSEDTGLASTSKSVGARGNRVELSWECFKKEIAVQCDILSELLDIAIAMRKPVVFHSRDARVEINSIVKPLLN